MEAALLSMNDVLLCGFGELPRHEIDAVVEHVMDTSNWARLTKRRSKVEGEGSVAEVSTAVPVPGYPGGPSSERASTAAGEVPPHSGSSSSSSQSAPSQAVAVAKPPRDRFVMPVPGMQGTVCNVLAGKVIEPSSETTHTNELLDNNNKTPSVPLCIGMRSQWCFP